MAPTKVADNHSKDFQTLMFFTTFLKSQTIIDENTFHQLHGYADSSQIDMF